MKKYILLTMTMFFFVSVASCKDDSDSDKKNKEEQRKMPVMTFEEAEYDFGEIPRGVPVTHIFKFKNTGNAPLVITDATSSCGCTVPEKPNNPIMPGKTGDIKVSYNASGSGNITKAITIQANVKGGRKTLKIRAFVEKKK